MRLTHLLNLRRAVTVLSFRSYGKFATPQEDFANELDALETLAKHSRVQLQLGTLHPNVRAQFFPKSKEDAVVLSSDILRKIVRDTDSVIALVDGAKDVPIFSLTPKSPGDESHNLFHKLGIKLAKGERAKTIRLRVNIDDHMLSIRTKQAGSFIRSGYVVVVLIKLPKHRIATSPSSDEEEKRLNKLAYDVDTQRFVTAFSAVPDASLQLLERSQSTEILFLLRPCESK